MNAERLLREYARISDAPDAIARLRRFILDLAVRGKLVPQDPNDEPAAELLKRIEKERARLIEVGEIRKSKATPSQSDAPFAIPSNWRWSHLAELGVLSPRNVAPDALEASFVPMPMIAAEYGVRNKHEIRPWGDIKKGYTHFAEGDVGLAKITPCFENGKSTVFRKLTGGIGAGTTELHVIRPLFVDQDFVLLFLKCPHFIESGIPRMTGTAGQKRVPIEYFAHSPFPLPPLTEQRRIVAKVDELMALCNRLEAERAQREAVRDRLTTASYARLSTPEPQTFPDAARFVLGALPALTARPDQTKRLRQAILNLAVRGKLVPQDHTEVSADDFDRTIPDDLERPFEIPETWRWARLHKLGKLMGGGTPSKGREEFWNGSIPWVSPKDMKIDHIAQAQMSISEAAISGSAANLIASGSVLFVVRGMILAHSFPVAISLAPLAINQDMKALVLNMPEMGEYVLRALKGIKLEMLKRVQRSSHGTCRLEGLDYSDFPLPIPPLAEQHRIVSKVDELMALCDRLEARLGNCAKSRSRLLEALLAEALAPSESATA
jgi:type I restriction enzyme, S subunit